MGSWHESRLRVRYEETDTMQVVYYAKVFVWMEVGRINLLRDIGLTYKDWEAMGVGMPVVNATADYRASARFDDEILVKTRIARLGNSSIKFENEILTGSQTCTSSASGTQSTPFRRREGRRFRFQRKSGRGLLRLSRAGRTPFVETLPALASQHPRSDHLPQQWRRPVLRVLELSHEHLSNVEGCVEADVVQ